MSWEKKKKERTTYLLLLPQSWWGKKKKNNSSTSIAVNRTPLIELSFVYFQTEHSYLYFIKLLPVMRLAGILSVRKSTTRIRLVAKMTPPCV